VLPKFRFIYNKTTLEARPAVLGLDKSRCKVSGAAPLPPETKDWFGRLGIPMYEA
jgi:long-subunit acyl-CoA synthetase (AMP-forming)